MLYIISLLVIYDTMIPLIYFFNVIFNLFILVFIAVHGFLIPVAVLVMEHGVQDHWLRKSVSLWCTGSVSPQNVGSFQTRDRACVRCIGRQILNHWATKEVPLSFFLFFFLPVVRTLNIRSTHFNFQVHNKILLTTDKVLYRRSLELFILYN